MENTTENRESKTIKQTTNLYERNIINIDEFYSMLASNDLTQEEIVFILLSHNKFRMFFNNIMNKED